MGRGDAVVKLRLPEGHRDDVSAVLMATAVKVLAAGASHHRPADLRGTPGYSPPPSPPVRP